MFVVNHVWVATLFCVVTMLGWSSWANTQKLAGKDKWAFPLYYWDYAVGVFLSGILLMLTLGSSAVPALAMSARVTPRMDGCGACAQTAVRVAYNESGGVS